MTSSDTVYPSAQSGRLALRLVLTLLAIALIAAAAWYLTRPKPIAVAVAMADTGRVETTVANTRAGSVMPCRRAKLAPPLGGRIERDVPVFRKAS